MFWGKKAQDAFKGEYTAEHNADCITWQYAKHTAWTLRSNLDDAELPDLWRARGEVESEEEEETSIAKMPIVTTMSINRDQTRQYHNIYLNVIFDPQRPSGAWKELVVLDTGCSTTSVGAKWLTRNAARYNIKVTDLSEPRQVNTCNGSTMVKRRAMLRFYMPVVQGGEDKLVEVLTPAEVLENGNDSILLGMDVAATAGMVIHIPWAKVLLDGVEGGGCEMPIAAFKTWTWKEE